MKNLIIYGTGSHAELVYAYFAKDSDYSVVAFTVEKAYLKQDRLFSLPVLPFEEIAQLIPPTEAEMFIAVGPFKQNSILQNYCEQAKAKGYQLASYFPSGPYHIFEPQYGENSFVDHVTKFHPYVSIGHGVSIISSELGHHAKVGNYSFISAARVGGNTIIEDYVFIGIGAKIKPGVRIGKGSFIAMGSIIVNDVEPYSVYSVPATKRREGLDARRLRSF